MLITLPGKQGISWERILKNMNLNKFYKFTYIPGYKVTFSILDVYVSLAPTKANT